MDGQDLHKLEPLGLRKEPLNALVNVKNRVIIIIVIITILIPITFLFMLNIEFKIVYNNKQTIYKMRNFHRSCVDYYADYLKYPVREQSGKDIFILLDGDIIDSLTNTDKEMNPRGIKYYDQRDISELIDPWGRSFKVGFDGDGDGKIQISSSTTIKSNIVLYSYGKDGVVSKDDLIVFE